MTNGPGDPAIRWNCPSGRGLCADLHSKDEAVLKVAQRALLSEYSPFDAQEDAYQAASNAWVTLMAGFTTVQSVARKTTFRCAMRLRKEYSPARQSLRPTSRSKGNARRPARLMKSALV
jgi:hypothetical protein